MENVSSCGNKESIRHRTGCSKSRKNNLHWRKHSDGRQSASSLCASIVTADRVLDATRRRTPTAVRVPDATGWHTLTADRIPDATGWHTLTADRVPTATAETLSRPTEYVLFLRKYCDGRQNNCCYRKKNYNGRQSTRYYIMEYAHGRQNTRCYRIAYSDGRQSSCHNGGSTLTADLILPRLEIRLCRFRV